MNLVGYEGMKAGDLQLIKINLEILKVAAELRNIKARHLYWVTKREGKYVS